MEEASASELNISEAQEQKQSESYMQDIKQIFMDKHVIMLLPAFSFILYRKRYFVTALWIIKFFYIFPPCNREM